MYINPLNQLGVQMIDTFTIVSEYIESNYLGTQFLNPPSYMCLARASAVPDRPLRQLCFRFQSTCWEHRYKDWLFWKGHRNRREKYSENDGVNWQSASAKLHVATHKNKVFFSPCTAGASTANTPRTIPRPLICIY